MTSDSGTVAVIKGQMSKFSGIIAKGLPKPKQKLIREMIYGIQTAKDIKLSCITRALNEPIRLIKMALTLPCPHEAVIIKYEEGKERKVTIHYNRSMNIRSFLLLQKDSGKNR
ncbi:MAG TPA: hypothetical protein DDW17_01290 [Deltaproteobacteria bacterium]|nr:hypothetical protein [Deltaproteobacteria bacterium]